MTDPSGSQDKLRQGATSFLSRHESLHFVTLWCTPAHVKKMTFKKCLLPSDQLGLQFQWLPRQPSAQWGLHRLCFSDIQRDPLF